MCIRDRDGVPHGGYYTKAELRELVRYAKSRGIEIVPEIDMPGHALSMIAAYPELACFEEPVEVATRFGVTDFSKKLFCAGSEKTFEFLFSLLDEVLEIFPFSYVHIGGDEAVKSEWKRCERCQKIMRKQGLKNERELQGYFLNRVIDYLALHGRSAIVWNDGLCDTLDKRAICQYWTPLAHGGKAEVARYVNAGGKAILSPVTRVYYDYPYAATPLKKTYEHHPTLRGIRREQQANILGVEAALWTEWVDSEDKLFFNTLPRLAATSETGWVAGKRASYDDFLRRLEPHDRLYDRLGLMHARLAEKPMSMLKRVQGSLTFLTKETHAELIDQQKQAKPEHNGGSHR
jgi:hexosaminidase